VSVDFYAIAQALAVRFGPTVVSAPSGETNVTQSTAALPATITDEPVVLVYPPSSVTLNYSAGTRSGIATYPVRFYIYKVRDTPRNAALIDSWIGSLYAMLDGQVHLGLSSYVTHAVVTNILVGPLSYGGVDFHGIELTVEVHVWEALSAQG
jgi:hypothetical protein